MNVERLMATKSNLTEGQQNVKPSRFEAPFTETNCMQVVVVVHYSKVEKNNTQTDGHLSKSHFKILVSSLSLSMLPSLLVRRR